MFICCFVAFMAFSEFMLDRSEEAVWRICEITKELRTVKQAEALLRSWKSERRN
jgi:hypothetical protein